MNTQITKKEFTELLANNKSVFVGCMNNQKTIPIERLNNIAELSDSIILPTSERRIVSAVKSNGIKFSDGSFLETAANGHEVSYHKIDDNFIYQLRKIDYSKDSSCSYDDIVYNVVMYYVEF